MSDIQRCCRATRLLTEVVASGSFDREYLAARLVVPTHIIDALLTGEVPISLDRQLRLAAFVIESMPPFVRAGQPLRSQVCAAMAREHAKRERTRRGRAWTVRSGDVS